MKKLLIIFVIVVLFVTNVISIFVYTSKLNKLQDEYACIESWEYNGEQRTSNIAQRYINPPSYTRNLTENLDIGQEEAVEIATAVYKTIDVYKDRLDDSQCYVKLYHDTDMNGVEKDYYAVWRVFKDEQEKVDGVGVTVLIEKKTGKIIGAIADSE